MPSETPAPAVRPAFSTGEDVSLLDVLLFLHRNWLWPVSAALALALAAIGWFELGGSQYEATSTCLVVESDPKQAVTLQVCQRMAESTRIAQRVSEKLKEKRVLDSNKDLTAGTIRAKILEGRTLTITSTAESPALAAAISNEAAAALIENCQALKTGLIDVRQTGYSRELPAIREQLQAAETHRSEVAGSFSQKMQSVYQRWRAENVKADEAAIATAAALQKETMDLLQAYQADTFAKVRALEESLKIEFLRTQVASLSGHASAAKPPREGYNAAFAANQSTAIRPRDPAASAGPSTWPKSKPGSTTAQDTKADKPGSRAESPELQNATGEFLAALATETNALKPETAFEPVPHDTLARGELAKALTDLAQAEATLRRLQSEREIGFIKLRQERAAKLERLKQDTEARQHDLLFLRDQELDGLRFAQDSADELALADLTSKRDFLNAMTRANNTATLAKAENGASEVQVIDVAIAPLSPAARPSLKYALAGLVLGAMLGFFIAAMREIARISRQSKPVAP